jgi:hypothetical protein
MEQSTAQRRHMCTKQYAIAEPFSLKAATSPGRRCDYLVLGVAIICYQAGNFYRCIMPAWLVYLSNLSRARPHLVTGLHLVIGAPSVYHVL